VPGNRKILVENWNETRSPIATDIGALRQLLPPGAIGLLGTLLLHSVVIQSVIVGYRAQKTHPRDDQVLGASLSKSDITPAENLVLIDLVSSSAGKVHDDLPVFAGAAITMTPIPKIHPDPLPLLDLGTIALSDDQEAAPPIDGGDGNERARLVGIYSNQMKARVERIWLRPRTPVNEESNDSKSANRVEYFQCQVQVVQDPRGNVQEVLLPSCNGTATWRRSLVVAIQQASPLPAPPSPTVFSRTVTLNFVAYPYHSGGSEDDYEPALAHTADIPSSYAR
jgi:TonB C terminal